MPTSRPATATVSLFIAITLAISAAVVYVLGHLFGNPDATILTVLVPSTVAVVMTAREAGWAGVRKLLRLRGSAPGSVRLLVTTALTIPVLALTAIALGSAVTGESYDVGMPAEGLVILLPLLIVVIGEEYGWRGFALPRLQGRYSALVASLIVGAAWWMWHYPASLIGTGVPLDTPFWLFGVFVLAGSVLMTSVFNASRGSVGLTMLFHLASNAAFVFLPLLPENRGGELTTFSIFVALAVVLAAMVVRINGPGSLASGRPHQARDRITATNPSITTASTPEPHRSGMWSGLAVSRVGQVGALPTRDQVPVPAVAVLWDPLSGGVVDPHEAEALAVAERPFEVVERAPDEVAGDGDAIGDCGGHRGGVLLQVLDAAIVGDDAVGSRAVAVAGAVLGDEDLGGAVVLMEAAQE